MHEPIRVYGEQHPSMVSRSSGRALTTRALVTDIKRNVLSVGEGTDHGNWYVFGPGGVQFMTQLPLPIPAEEHREDFRRAGNQYFMDVGELAIGSYADSDLVMAPVNDANDALGNMMIPFDPRDFEVGDPSPHNPRAAAAPSTPPEAIDEEAVDLDAGDVEPGDDPLDADVEEQPLQMLVIP